MVKKRMAARYVKWGADGLEGEVLPQRMRILTGNT